VLTLDRDGYLSGKPWSDTDAAYKALSEMSEAFLKRIRRWMVRESMKPVGSEWGAVVEAHRSGWPHMNLLVFSPELARLLETQRAERELVGMSARECVLLGDELLTAAMGAGWGAHSTAEPVRNKDAVAGYITKLAGLAGAAGSEIAKITQAPLSAPVRFRRLRAGKLFLPSRGKSDDDVTGTLVRRTHDVRKQAAVVLPLHDPRPEDREHVAQCCYHEEDLMAEEARVESWNRAALAVWPAAAVRLPIVSTWTTWTTWTT
jgi:hypothetical protein